MFAQTSSSSSPSSPTTDDTQQVCTGQGIPSSLAARAISDNRLSIVDRLAARSLTGQGLRVRVHQHYGYRLHLQWKGNRNREGSSRFMERHFRGFPDVLSFCEQLCDGRLEGLTTCVYDMCYKALFHKASTCRREPILSSQTYLLRPKRWLRAAEERNVVTDWCTCFCNITSANERAIQWGPNKAPNNDDDDGDIYMRR